MWAVTVGRRIPKRDRLCAHPQARPDNISSTCRRGHYKIYNMDRQSRMTHFLLAVSAKGRRVGKAWNSVCLIQEFHLKFYKIDNLYLMRIRSER